MATRILTTLQDDIDGSVATETVRFGLDGVEWEIDLSGGKKSGPVGGGKTDADKPASDDK